MSSASKVAHTKDILHIIFSHLSDNKDLPSLLRTSPLFFGLIAQKLYRSLPISNVLNPLLGVDAGGRGGPYGKTKLLELVQTVIVERAPLPVGHSVWANWYKRIPPLPAVETVIIHPADKTARQQGGADKTLPNDALIERLCRDASRLHLSTPFYTARAKGFQSMPSLPCVKTLVVMAHAGEFTEVKYVVGKLTYGPWNHGRKEYPPCLNIKAVHILLWGDLVNPGAGFLWLTGSTNELLGNKILHDLCEIVENFGTRFSINELWLYNADTILERLSEWTKSRKVDDIKAKVEIKFAEEMKTSAEVWGMPEEAAKAQVFWRTGHEFLEAFCDMPA
ncbi:hypothetical protein L198_00071 [Cryptococcus wingfieldii CBS 7118]|uniref:F-box domain-containing protein n=1 Tax=Cryptococcus wingfieldii CBS 7118 TaxID=1295528 RepID=A0A1E3K5Y4_9TREE|nr:hypothetical protein L198_00071 [Cryptococcus wingfieldii CBS 7118]ODO08346.1 hypothetical protein L198_00071 [Cryptococcus wingfieldii CBS 7118]